MLRFGRLPGRWGGPQGGAQESSDAIPGGAASAARLNVTDAAAVEALVQDVVAKHGRLDYLFDNAGVFIVGEVHHMSLADWNRIIDINLRGVARRRRRLPADDSPGLRTHRQHRLAGRHHDDAGSHRLLHDQARPRRSLHASLPIALYPVESCARDILRGVERNQAVIVVTRSARAAWWFYRLAPGLFMNLAQRFAEKSPMLNRPAARRWDQ